MLLSRSSPDAASRAALRSLMGRLPGMSVVDSAAPIDAVAFNDPPVLRAAQIVEGTALRAIRIPDLSLRPGSEFGAFLDGAQKVQIVGHHHGMPIVFGTASAAVRVRVDKRMITWGHQAPRVERRIFLPLRYLPALADWRPSSSGVDASQWQIIDTSTADQNGEYPSQHPAVLLERAIRAVDQEREALEDQLAEAWCDRSESPLYIDGGISRSAPVASSSFAIGVIKSHRTLYVEGEGLPIVLGLEKGARSSVFRVSPRSRSSVLSWYLRLRDPKGRDAMWGLVRVEVAECERPEERANEISRWVLAETTPLSLPDGRWDKMAYGIHDCEEFLRAIS